MSEQRTSESNRWKIIDWLIFPLDIAVDLHIISGLLNAQPLWTGQCFFPCAKQKKQKKKNQHINPLILSNRNAYISIWIELLWSCIWKLYRITVWPTKFYHQFRTFDAQFGLASRMWQNEILFIFCWKS